MNTVKDLKLPAALSAVTHVYDKHSKKVYDVELHKHLRKVRDDLASGRSVYVPKRKA